jgi:hypothetical protein
VTIFIIDSPSFELMSTLATITTKRANSTMLRRYAMGTNA